MDLPAIILLEGFLFTVVFGALSLSRREGLSVQVAGEATGLTLLTAALTAFTPLDFNPVFFLFFLWLVTLRARLLVDLGNAFARRKEFGRADAVYGLANRLWPDRSSRLILQVNQAISLLQRGESENAIGQFKEVLQQAGEGHLGIKYEAAAHYNMGVAYLRQGSEKAAVSEFNSVLDTWPACQYARPAQAALNRLKHKPEPPASTTG